MHPAFDTIASGYDKSFTDTAVGRLLRERVWTLLSDGVTLSHPVTTAMDLNCGTGEDAIWLAKQGWQVLATDISPEMAAATWQKVEAAGLKNQVKIQVCSFAEISRFSGRQFDLVFSNFGGLNCASPEELEELSLDLQKLIAPGGQFVAVVMSRFCWQETLYFLLKLNPREAFRRLNRKPVSARLDEKTTVPTWYFSPNEIQRCFSDFQVKRVSPVGFWLPPSYLNPFFEKRPRLLSFLNFLEKNFAPAWLASAADHFLICLEKSSDDFESSDE